MLGKQCLAVVVPGQGWESNQSDGMNCNVGEQCLGEAVVEQWWGFSGRSTKLGASGGGAMLGSEVCAAVSWEQRWDTHTFLALSSRGSPISIVRAAPAPGRQQTKQAGGAAGDNTYRKMSEAIHTPM